MSWKKVKQELDFPEGSSELNLERVRKSGLQGNQTAVALTSALTKKVWQSLTKRQQEDLTTDLIHIADEQTLRNRLARHWHFEPGTIEKLLNTSLPKGYMHLSQTALRNILVFLQQVSTPENRGLTYDQACAQAGYAHSDTAPKQRFDDLPFPGRAARGKERRDGTVLNPANHSEALNSDPMRINELRNPMVERALYQVRKVVNAIIKTYGKPAIIRVEMARNLKANSKQRKQNGDRNKENEKKNKAAEAKLQEYGIGRPSRNDIIKHKLWVECGKICPYTARPSA